MSLHNIEYRIALKCQIKTIEKEIKAIDEILRADTQEGGGTLDYKTVGCVLNEATRETIDKKKAKELLGDLQYNQIIKKTKYKIFTVYDKKQWPKYKEKFIKKEVVK